MTVRNFVWYTLAWGITALIGTAANVCAAFHHSVAGIMLTAAAVYAAECIGQKWRRAYPEKAADKI